MKKIFFALMLFVAGAILMFADEYKPVRVETYDGQGKLQSVNWMDWDYFNKSLLVFREGNTLGQEYVYKYIKDPKFVNPFKKMTYLVKDPEPSNASSNEAYSTTLYNYNTSELVTLEITIFANGDKESITYMRDKSNRIISKRHEISRNNNQSTVMYMYDYSRKNVTTVKAQDGSSGETTYYDNRGDVMKTETSTNGKIDTVTTYRYDGRRNLASKTIVNAAGKTISVEKYSYGLYKPSGEVRTNMNRWLSQYGSNWKAMESVIQKYYANVARNDQYNDQMRQGYYLVGNGYFKSEQYNQAIVNYKKALSFGLTNVAGSEDINILRTYFYVPWDITASKSNGPEYYCAYNIACCLSRLNRFDEALLWLDFALQIGFKDKKLMAIDADLEFLKLMKEQEFKQIQNRTWHP